MTKVLIISNKSDITSDFIVKELKKQKIDFYRFNTEEISKSIQIVLHPSSSKYEIIDSNKNITIDLHSFTSVYYRRPELPEIEIDLSISEKRFVQNEITFTLEGIYKLLRTKYWINHVYAIREAENKIYQLELAKSLEFTIPNSIVTNNFAAAKSFYFEQNQECIVKPIKSGLIDESDTDSKVVFTSKINEFPAESKKIELSPTYLQKSIKKKGDIRVIIVGNKFFPALIHSQGNNRSITDWRRSSIPLEHSKIDLPQEVKEKCIKLLTSLNLKYGALDFILDENETFIFLEINPNGQWAWIERQLGYKISKSLVNLLRDENI